MELNLESKRHINPSRCTWAFPPGETNTTPPTPELWRVNKYGGYKVWQDRLARIDGDQDVWLDICYHSNLGPLRYSTSPREEDLHPQLLITGGGHHWDSYGLGSLKNVSLEPQFIRNAHLWEIRTVKKWLDDCMFELCTFGAGSYTDFLLTLSGDNTH